MGRISLTFMFLFVLIVFINLNFNLAQNISAVPALNPFPSAYTTDWETNPSALGSVNIFNSSSQDIDFKLRVRIFYNNSTSVFIGTGNLLTVPAFSSINVNNTQIISMSSAEFPNNKLKNQVIQTGRLPEGNYRACFDVLNSRNSLILSNVCANFTILYPEPPKFIYPANNDSLTESTDYPIFQWTPVVVPPGYQIRYIFKLCEILPGQTPHQALSANVPVYENQNVMSTSFVYPISAMPLVKTKKYAWQVQVLDQYNLPPTKNNGKSDISQFKFQSHQNLFSQDYIHLLEPANDVVLYNKVPKFSWESHSSQLSFIKYKLIIKTHSNSNTNLSLSQVLVTKILDEKEYQPNFNLPIKPGKKYDWYVEIFEISTGKVLNTSDISTFQLSDLILKSPTNNYTSNTKRTNFSWEQAGDFVENNHSYNFKIVAIPSIMTPDYNINDLFDNGPYFYFDNLNQSEIEITNSSGYTGVLFKPKLDFQFQESIRYAWRIDTRNSNNEKLVSEIRYFRYDPYQSGFATNCLLSGNIKYNFGAVSAIALKNSLIKLVTKYVLKDFSDNGNQNYNDYNGVSIVNSSGIELKDEDLPPQYRIDNQKTVATAYTNDEGSFSFSFMNTKPAGVVENNFTLSNKTHEFGYSYQGKLYRTFRIIVQNPYFLSREKDIIIQPGESKDLPSERVAVRDYSLKVKVAEGSFNTLGGTLEGIPNTNVFLFRANSHNNLPENEGKPKPDDPDYKPDTWLPPNSKLIAKAKTDINGEVTFQNLVKSVYAQNDCYYIFAASDSTSSMNYQSILSTYKFTYPEDRAIYMYQYTSESVNTQIVGIPLQPSIKGYVKRSDSGLELNGVNVKLLEYYTVMDIRQKNTSTQSGRFSFEDLKVENSSGVNDGIKRKLKLEKYGYKKEIIDIEKLKYGQKWYNEILLDPESKIVGNIVDEYGNNISARVKVDGGSSVTALANVMLTGQNSGSPSGSSSGNNLINLGNTNFIQTNNSPSLFEIAAPKGIVNLTIDPQGLSNNNLIKLDTTIFITENIHDIGAIVLKLAKHRLRIFVGNEELKNSIAGQVASKLVGVKVKLSTTDGTLIGEKLTGPSGYADFEFLNNESSFNVLITGPKDRDFEILSSNLENVESGEKENYYFYLKPAASISGYVYVADNNFPLTNAKVYINYANSNLITETVTGSFGIGQGRFKLRNVPIGSHLVKASKKSSNLIGDQKTLTVPKEGLENIIFRLKIYSDMDITHLMGFPIEVDSLVDNNGVISISGNFVDLDSLENNYFKTTTKTIRFNNIEVEADPTQTSIIFDQVVPVSKPKTLPLKTEENDIPLDIFNNYSGTLTDNTLGIELINDASNKGVLKGKVYLSNSSFKIPAQNLKFPTTEIILKEPGVKNTSIAAITADKSDPFSVNYFELASNKNNLTKLEYEIYGFEADVDLTKSYLFNDSLIFYSTLHTNISDVDPSDLMLDIGNVVITKSFIKRIKNQSDPISFSLGEWKLDLSKWLFNGTLTATEGTLRTQTVDLPIKQLTIAPENLKDASFIFNSMSLAGVVPLNVIGKVLFGHELSSTKWFLTIDNGDNDYAASFSGLPGMNPSDSIFIQNFSLYSDGTKQFTPRFGDQIQIYDIGTLSLANISVGDEILELSSLKFVIPEAGEFKSNIFYYKENGNVKLKLFQTPVNFSKGKVQMAFGNTVADYPEYFNENGLIVRGKISEPGKFDLFAWLYHSKDSTSIWLETPNTPLTKSNQWQRLEIGGPNTYLNKIHGNMQVTSNKWNELWFSGNLVAPSGIEESNSKLTFTVFGDIVANNQELGVKNISTPFGNINVTYEPENKRFIGKLSVTKDLNYAYMEGDAQFIVDAEGWYFVSAGYLRMYNPNSEGSSVLLIGNHSITDSMRQIASQYSYVYKHLHRLPSTFPTYLKGFYLEGMASIPIQSIIGLPNIDIDLGVVSARLWVNAGADNRLSMQFSNNITIGSGVDYFIDAGFEVSQWMVVECSKLSFSTLIDMGADGVVSSNGSWSADVHGFLKLTGKAKVGYGICSSSCGGKLCDEESWSGSKTFGVNGHIGSDGKYLNFYIENN